jgi:hypothetical protein
MLQWGAEMTDYVALSNGTGRVLADTEAMSAISSQDRTVIICLDYSGFDRTVNAIDLGGLALAYERFDKYNDFFGATPDDVSRASEHMYGARYMIGDTTRRQQSLGSGRIDTSAGGSTINVATQNILIREIRRECDKLGVTFRMVRNSAMGDDAILSFHNVSHIPTIIRSVINVLNRLDELGKKSNLVKEEIGTASFLKVTKKGGWDVPRVMGASSFTSEDVDAPFKVMDRMNRIIGLSSEAIVRGADPQLEERFNWAVGMFGVKYFVTKPSRNVPEKFILRRFNRDGSERSAIVFIPAAALVESPSGGGLGLVPGTIPGTSSYVTRGLYGSRPTISAYMQRNQWISSLMRFSPRSVLPKSRPEKLIDTIEGSLIKDRVDRSKEADALLLNNGSVNWDSRLSYFSRASRIVEDVILEPLSSLSDTIVSFESKSGRILETRQS